MDEIKVSQLDAVDEVRDTDVIMEISGGANKKATIQQVKDNIVKDEYGTADNSSYAQSYQNEHNVVVSPTEPTTNERVWFKYSKNLLPVGTKTSTTTAFGITYTISNGEITLNGTATSGGDIYTEIPFNLVAGTYSFKANIKSGTLSGIIGKYISASNSNIIDGGRLERDTAVTTTLNSDKIGCVLHLYFGNGVVCNNLKFNVMLNSGSSILPYEPYMAPSINVDGEEMYSTNYNNYSTTEQVIGKWTDGKTLYRKVITATIASGTTSTEVNINVPNFGYVIKADVRFNSIGSADYVYGAYYSGATDYMRFFMRNNMLQIRLGSNSNGFNIVAILEYTKTTD